DAEPDPRSRPGQAGRARPDHAGARGGGDQHRGLRAPPRLAGVRRRPRHPRRGLRQRRARADAPAPRGLQRRIGGPGRPSPPEIERSAAYGSGYGSVDVPPPVVVVPPPEEVDDAVAGRIFLPDALTTYHLPPKWLIPSPFTWPAPLSRLKR